MGTSKGYQAPTEPNWRKAKGALKRYLNSNHDSNERNKAVRDYATAHLQASSLLGMASTGVKIVNLFNLISENGIDVALQKVGLDNLIGKSGDIVYNGIIYYFSNGTGDLEDGIIKNTISQLLIDYQVCDITDFVNFDFAQFFMSFIVTYIQVDFKTMFYEKILSDKTPEESKNIIEDINRYIAFTINQNYDAEELSKIDWKDVEGQAFVDKICKECYELLQVYEGV